MMVFNFWTGYDIKADINDFSIAQYPVTYFQQFDQLQMSALIITHHTESSVIKAESNTNLHKYKFIKFIIQIGYTH